jgi:hypothetical protein
MRHNMKYIVIVFAILACTAIVTSAVWITSASNIMLSYHRSGGIAGLDDQLVIDDGGYCELQRVHTKGEFTLEPSQLRHLIFLLDEADFFSLNDTYLPTDAGADLIEYVITYNAEGKKLTVYTMDGAVPDTLQPILDELAQIISSNS